ncbi:MAG: hypothetical protein M1823_001155 [Watsoniomyces obsoletus]|nr:MAG: hypothetical protein M1823_001155 [Watsoniomyces obsoletus]
MASPPSPLVSSHILIGTHWFLVLPNAIAKIKSSQSLVEKESNNEGDYIPATVIPGGGSGGGGRNISKEGLENIIRDFEKRDDVWSKNFLAAIIVPEGDAQIEGEVGFQTTLCHLDSNGRQQPPPGPYAIHRWTGNVYQVHKLYPDSQQAFQYGTTEAIDAPGTYRPTLVQDHIAVPSRLYYKRSAEKPLAGDRFAAKDLFDVAGCKTGCGNAAWSSLYPPVSEHAVAVKRLLDAGAVLVGKTKTTQFAEGYDPAHWVDYQSPFNPRGDGYQMPSSSSTGSAAAVAAYEWLDFALGTDTGGSIRAPAGVNGVYGTRPSIDANDSTGVFQVSALLDTVGLFARSAATTRNAGLSLLPSSNDSTTGHSTEKTRRYKLLYPIRPEGRAMDGSCRWFPQDNGRDVTTEAEQAMERVVQALEAHLGCQRHPFNLDDFWRQTRPENQPDSLDAATGSIYSIMTTYSAVHEGMPKFLFDYAAQNDGRQPFFDPVMAGRLEYGRKQTRSAYDEAVKGQEMFTKWVEEALFATNDDKDTIPILIFPQSWGQPAYRDVGGEPIITWNAFSAYAFSYLSGCPDYTIPVGEVGYESRITNHQEYLPVSLSMLSRRGNDVILFDILQELEKEGSLKEVMPGTRMYQAD